VAHEAARRAAAGTAIPAHARLETYSVLTRMPPPHKLAPDVVAGLLDRWFPPDRTILPSAELAAGIVRRCCDLGIDGGAVYDALIAFTAAEARRSLLSLDTRAARTYRRARIDFDLLG
jgi:hypothetical protein